MDYIQETPLESNFWENNWGNKPQFHLRERGRLVLALKIRNMLAESSYFFPQYHKICMIVPIKRKKTSFQKCWITFSKPWRWCSKSDCNVCISSSRTTFQRGVSPCFKTRGVCSLRRSKRRKFYTGSSQLSSQTNAPKSSQQQSSVMSSVWGRVSWGDSHSMRIFCCYCCCC